VWYANILTYLLTYLTSQAAGLRSG